MPHNVTAEKERRDAVTRLSDYVAEQPLEPVVPIEAVGNAGTGSKTRTIVGC